MPTTFPSEVKLLSRVRLLATPWTAAYQAPPSMGFSRQEYWSGVPSPSLHILNLTDNRYYGRNAIIEYNHGQRSLAGFGP